MSEENNNPAPYMMPRVVKIDEEVYLINPDDYELWIGGDSTMDAMPIAAIGLKPMFTYLVKYPFMPAKIKYFEAPKKPWFSKSVIRSYYTTFEKIHIQSRSVKVMSDIEDDYYLDKTTAETKTSLALLNEYNELYK